MQTRISHQRLKILSIFQMQLHIVLHMIKTQGLRASAGFALSMKVYIDSHRVSESWPKLTPWAFTHEQHEKATLPSQLAKHLDNQGD